MLEKSKGGGRVRRMGAVILVVAALLLGGCGRAKTPAIPADCPRSMTAVVYAEGAADAPERTSTVSYTYQTDDAGRVVERRYTLGGAAYRERTTYDDAGRAVCVMSDRLANDAPAAGSVKHVYTYDADGRRLSDESYAREGTAETLTSRTVYTYDGGARAVGAVVTDGAGAALAAVTFTYTPAAAFAKPADAQTDYDYTAAALVEETVTTAAGGVVARSRCAYDAADRPLYRESGGAYETFAYDGDGRLLTHASHRDGTVYEERYTYG